MKLIERASNADNESALAVNPHSGNSPIWVFLPLLLLTATALDLYRLTGKSLWMDEGFSVFMAQTDFQNFWHLVRGGEINMVLYYLALRSWMYFGQHEFWLRLLSAFPAIITVAVVYALGKRFFAPLSAFFAALLFAVHPSQVMYAQEMRSYSLALLLVTLSCLFFLRLLEDGRRLNWLGYVVSSALAPYAHVFSVLVLITQWTWLALFFPKQLHKREMKTALAVLLVLQLPLAWIALSSYHAAIAWVPAVTADRILDVLPFLSLPKWRAVLYIAAWLGAVVCFFRTNDKALRSRIMFLVFWLLFPFLLSLLISLHKPVLVERFLLISLPGSVLLAADGIRRLPRSISVLAFLIIAFFSCNSVLSYYRHLHTHEDWRGASAYVLSQAQPRDEVVIVPAYCRFTFDYYRRESPFSPTPVIYGDLETTPSWTPESMRVWLLVRDLPANPATDAFIQGLSAKAYFPYEIRETRRFNLIRVLLVTRSTNRAR